MTSKSLPRTTTRKITRFAPALIVAALFVVAVLGVSAANFSFFGKKAASTEKTGSSLQAAPRDLNSPLASTLSSLVATVATDKGDYAPGETVVMTGSGWQ